MGRFSFPGVLREAGYFGCMSNPLIPQLRADKNGKMVTRHVSDKSASTSKVKPLPAPLHPAHHEAPVKTEKELKQEACKTLVELVSRGFSASEKEVDTAMAVASWLRLEQLQTLSHIAEYQNRPFAPSTGAIWNELRGGRSFHLGMAASTYELSERLHQTGFHGLGTPLIMASSYFGAVSAKYIKDSNISDFRLHVLANALDLENYETNDGKFEHYRQLANLNSHYDEVVKALPVLFEIMSDYDNHILDDSIEDIVAASIHAARHTEPEIERIAAFVRDRKDMDHYDTDLIDEMLKTEASSMSSGVL